MPQRVSAIILAAGRSRRMGQPKELLLINDRPAVACVVQALQTGGIPRITIVLGSTADKVRAVLGVKHLHYTVNPLASSEMVESVRFGIAAIDPATTGVVVCPVDHPLIHPDTLQLLLKTHEEEPTMILIPCYNGRRGHPALFPFSLIGEVFIGRTLREIIERHPDRVLLLDTDDEGVILGMDTPEEYQRVIEKSRDS